MAKSTKTSRAAKATTQKEIWVFVLDNSSITSKLTDFTGNEVKTPQNHFLYATTSGGADIADDGSKPLFHSASGILDPIELQSMIDKYSKPPSVPPLTGLTISGSDSVEEAKTSTYTAAAVPTGANAGTVTWTSSDTAIATIEATGKLTAVKAGSVTITAKSGSITATKAVTITAKP